MHRGIDDLPIESRGRAPQHVERLAGREALPFHEDSLRLTDDGDPLMGRKLFATFRAAGITDPQISVSQQIYVTGEAKAMPWNTIEATADAIVASGVASREKVDAALADLDQFLQDPTTMIGSPRNFQCWARRSQT